MIRCWGSALPLTINMLLDERSRNLAEELGMDFFGVADLSPARDFILSQGGKEIANYPMAVSIGIILLDSIVDQLPNRTDVAVVVSLDIMLRTSS